MRNNIIEKMNTGEIMSHLKIDEFGVKRWYNDEGEYHRDDGPAIEYRSGTKYWYINGKLHRENGPAREYNDNYKVWYYSDEFIGDSVGGFTQEDFERYLRSLKIKEYW